MKTALTYNSEDFPWLKSRQKPLNVDRYPFLSSVAIQNFELHYSFIPHSAHNKSRNTYTERVFHVLRVLGPIHCPETSRAKRTLGWSNKT